MNNGSCNCGGHKCSCMKIAKWLLIIGGINWGLVGVGMLMGNDWNVVKMLLGAWPVVEAVIYILVGVAAIMKLVGCRCKTCMGACSSNGGGMGMDKKM